MHYRKKAIILAATLGLVLGSFIGVQAETKVKSRKPVTISGKSFLPLKVLARPFSNIYKEADEKSAVVEENVPVFQTYFVYSKPKESVTSTETKGWYEVGSDKRGTVLGWMKADDVMEWKQAMCLAYEHPTGRKPVLMFENIEPLRELVKLPAEERVKKAEEYYQQIASKDFPKDFPIVSMEPEGAIDITKQFYLLPILESAGVEIEGREGRLLKLAAATKSGRGKKTLGATSKTTEEKKQGEVKLSSSVSPDPTNQAVDSAAEATTEGNKIVAQNDTVKGNSTALADTSPSSDAKIVENTLEGGLDLDQALIDKLNMDIVFVVDMTSSMQPYIDATREAIKGISQQISGDPAIADKVRFGLWGYRDATEIPGMDFDAKNFTEQLQDVSSFTQIMENVKVTPKGSAGYDEDVFSGVDQAMRNTAWRENALKILVLVGDAPSHEPGHKWNLSGQSAETLRIFADDNNISLAALHIINPKANQYNELAEQQFRTLSHNPGTEDSVYIVIPSTDLAQMTSEANALAGDFIALMKEASQGHVAKEVIPQPSKQGAIPKTQQKSRKLGVAALVTWIGSQKGIEAPSDTTAWVTDKDLIDPSVSSLDVRVLLNKNNLNSLKKTLGEILTAGSRGQISGEDFFDALVAVATIGERDPEQIRNAKNLAATGLLPEFMVGLPYKSQIMEMNNELWSSMSIDQQQEFLNGLDAKLQLYTTIHDTPDGWVALTAGADEDEKVYPLSLEALP